MRTLVPRQEMTGADRSWAQQYQVDDILRYSRSIEGDRHQERRVLPRRLL